TGRNALYLAGHGWEAVGVEMAGYAVEVARRKASEQGVAARFVQGDVTRLPDLDIGAGFNLFMDGGCYHTIPPGRRDAYGKSVTAVAAPGARLIMVGFRRPLGAGVDGEGLLKRLPGWRLLRADRVHFRPDTPARCPAARSLQSLALRAGVSTELKCLATEVLLRAATVASPGCGCQTRALGCVIVPKLSSSQRLHTKQIDARRGRAVPERRPSWAEQ
ncbi:MAG TPA: class I SAM-dependent methyltransferase, partial [Mycobacterium sp.]